MIKQLSKDLINKIAAGEVVERPASIVKELMENAIDAHATVIKVKIIGGGMQMIRIEDDGDGIDESDVPKLFHSHATSKISTIDDLQLIHSFGFRGEALASIASISEVTLITKNEIDSFASKVSIKNGKNTITKSAGIKGTTLIVENLFYNIPVRRKFMKSEKVEFSYCLKVFQQIALVHPEIEFQLATNEKIVYQLYPQSKDERIKYITKLHLLSFQTLYDSEQLKIEGSLTPPGTLETSALQYIFVNERPIHSALIIKAVKQVYTSLLKKELKPSFIILITIDPKDVDVNVHPRKDEVRFLDQNNIFSKIYKACLAYLMREMQLDEKPSYQGDDYLLDSPIIDPPKVASQYVSNPDLITKKEFDKYTPRQINNSFLSNMFKESNFTNLNEVEKSSDFLTSSELLLDAESEIKKQCFQIDKKLICYFENDAVVFIDQHAASERIYYEKITHEFLSRSYDFVIPLIPIYIELNQAEYAFALAHSTIFKDFGIEIMDMGTNMIGIGKYYTFYTSDKIIPIFEEILSNIHELTASDQKFSFQDKIIASIACRSATMFNQILSQEEMQNIISNLEKCKMPYTCAHGRPIRYSIPLKEILRHLARC